MPRILRNLQSIYDNYRVIPFVLCISVAIDYTLTLYLAGSKEAIRRYEFSPLLRYVIEHDIVAIYLVCTIFFYYISAYMVLKLIKDEPVYCAGVALILLLSLTHLLGGLSWVFRKAWYSNTVLALSLASIALAIVSFGYVILRRA
ncbi:MAG: hypothetical protein U9R10_03295 [Euryarchaeota archaeon]|nr:hypothetical protein [Euryarchaeota archaeon]